MFKLEKSLQNGDVMANVVSFGTSRVQNLKIGVQNLTSLWRLGYITEYLTHSLAKIYPFGSIRCMYSVQGGCQQVTSQFTRSVCLLR